MHWRISAHPNAISKNVHSIAAARFRVFYTAKTQSVISEPPTTEHVHPNQCCTDEKKLLLIKRRSAVRDDRCIFAT